MREPQNATEPGVKLFATEGGEIVLEQLGSDAVGRVSVRIPHEKIHQVTVWMRRLAAEFDGLTSPAQEAAPAAPTVI